MRIFKENKIILIALVLLVTVLLLFTLKKDTKNTDLSSYKKTTSEQKKGQAATDTSTENSLPNDYEHAEAIKELLKEYPWYSKLPIDNNEYTIVWDLDIEKFRIRLKIPETSPQESKDSLIAKAVEDIKTLTGEDFQKYTYYVLYPRTTQD
ncbi:hypothetical protein GYA37_02630 [candidate division WWE3 bacterium]|uniref:Uncharacterized protein n=1 Tax=candidate division WWE3 bacterium TaxID=2053526 RepID=A0A7X9HSU2_UNCKA|nr:hypothetical protein [candidate division WWE3 bacterium]